MRKLQSSSSDDNADSSNNKSNERSNHHNNGTKRSENGSSVHQRQRSKMHLENLTSGGIGNEKPKPLILELIIQKDKNGYGMKVSGENPVYVDSVKEGGAAHRAGLNAADMILRVNGHNVRYSTHGEVVQLMKATHNVELTVQRSSRPFPLPLSAVSSNLGTPTTPTSQRNSITAPLPVDHMKRKEVEYTKLHTLHLMLEQEKKNLDKLRENESQNGNEIAKAETNIKKLQDQLNQSKYNDISTSSLVPIITSTTAKVTSNVVTTTSPSTGPNIFARFERSLSQLNLGGKRKSTATTPSEPIVKPVNTPSTPMSSSSSSSTPVPSPNHQKSSRSRQHSTVSQDNPPPLPQRNAPRKSLPTSPIAQSQISDLDASMMASAAAPFGSGMGAKKKNKNKIKANSDPKMSSELMLQMEASQYPPPLPPRTNFHEDGVFGQIVTNKDSMEALANDGRPLPNSLATQLNFPLITTSVTVREGAPPPNYHHHHHHHSFDGTNSCNMVDGIKVKSKKESKNRSSNIERSPPGTPPPPYPDSNSVAQTNIEQCHIMSFEDENDDEDLIGGDDGIYKSISILTASENVAYLVVFLNFVLCNSKPAAILFYLITDLYKKGNVKDMRKWAYEIHSTFLVPAAPLSFFTISDTQAESLAHDIDEKLSQAQNYQPQEKSNQQDFEMAKLLRDVFQKSRSKARDTVNRQMEEFQEKRLAGLGTMFGPSAVELAVIKGNKQMESKIVEDYLMPKLTSLLDECEQAGANCEDVTMSSKMALTSALSTVVHKIFLPRGSSTPGSERIHHYVTREKSFKSRLISKTRKLVVRGHHLSLRQYYETTTCNHCFNLIWGVAPQGYACSDCGFNVHRSCSKLLEETCPGPVNNGHVDKFNKFINKIRDKAPIQNSRKHDDEGNLSWEETTTDRSQSFSARPKGDTQFQRPTLSSNSTSQLQLQNDSSQSSDFHTQGSSSTIAGSLGGSSNIVSSSTLINQGIDGDQTTTDGKKSKQKISQANARSESYKESSPKRSRTNRPKSDPSLYEDEVPSPVDINQDDSINTSTSMTPGRPHTGTSLDSSPATSDDESSKDMEQWGSVTAEMIQQLTEVEKKRQEIINEMFETEKSHVKTLKVLHTVFMVPLEQSKAMTPDLIHLVFPPSLLELKEWHNSFEASLRQRWKDYNGLFKEIGDCLHVFDGSSGENLKEHAARFCARQQIALEMLKERRKKDENLHRGLVKAESHKACRRLQLKDLLPAVLQRLTKYPLLFERLHKCSEGSEAEAIKKALDASKSILDYVNQEVRIAEELRSIQRKLDKSSYDKEAPNEFKNIDLTNYKLVHDGLLTIKKGTIQLRVLLFDNMIVLLQKQDDKYLLKQFAHPATVGDNKPVNPITKISNLLVRLIAVDKRAFFLIDKEDSHMLEMTAASENDSKIWIQKITEAAEKANHLRKIQNKPLPSIPHVPPAALEETPESKILEPPSEQPSSSETEKPSDDSHNDKDEPSEPSIPQDDPNAITTTQPCQLIQPGEINILSQDVHNATLIITPQEDLRRHSELIQKSINEMGKIICEINRVPQEDFNVIADIASQPEASPDLAELCLAAFSQSKYLFETMSSELVNSVNVESPSNFGLSDLCDNCSTTRAGAGGFGSEVTEASAAQPAADETDKENENDNLYCEIETLDKLKVENNEDISHIEINENYSTLRENNRKYPVVRVDKIASSINTLHSLVSKLTMKIAERDQERETYRRENQRLRQQLHLFQGEEIVENAIRDLSTEPHDSDQAES